jgi:hypothetical protein
MDNRPPDVAVGRTDPCTVKHSSSNRVGDIEWPSEVYLETARLQYAAGSILISFQASDQGWGNTGFCYIQLRSVSPEGAVVSQRLATLGHAVTDYTGDFSSEDLHKSLKKGHRLQLVAVSAPWGGFATKVLNGRISVWYNQRYEMAVLRKQLDKYNIHRVCEIFRHVPVQAQDQESEEGSAVGGLLSSVLAWVGGGSSPTASDAAASTATTYNTHTCTALSFLFVRCDPLLFSIIVKFAYA